MTTRRHLLVFGPLASLLALGIGGWLLWPATPGTAITRENFEKIQEGMTLPEVEAILCAQPGDYGIRRRGIILDLYGGGVFMNPGQFRSWGGDEGFIQAGFDGNEIVLWKRFVESGPPLAESPFDALRRWLRL